MFKLNFDTKAFSDDPAHMEKITKIFNEFEYFLSYDEESLKFLSDMMDHVIEDLHESEDSEKIMVTGAMRNKFISITCLVQCSKITKQRC